MRHYVNQRQKYIHTHIYIQYIRTHKSNNIFVYYFERKTKMPYVPTQAETLLIEFELVLQSTPQNR